MRIGLIGFGKTGKAVASVLLQNEQFSLQWILRQSTSLENRNAADFLGITSRDPGVIFSAESVQMNSFLDENPVDYIIDFSSGAALYLYGRSASERNITIISAISHYAKEERDLLQKLSEKTTVFWSPNITLGVNYLMFASKLLKRIAPFVDIEIVEEHFKTKEGISGTALKIAEVLDLDNSSINSLRVGGVVGRHEVVFGFPYQTVRIVHESISREAFGNGVLFVAKNLINKERGFYNFEDVLRPYFQA